METMKTTCLYCGMVGEMEVKDKYFFDGVDGRLYEVECPRCHRSFGRKVTEEPKGGLQHGGKGESAGKT